MTELAQQPFGGLLYSLKRFGLQHGTLELAARLGWAARGVLYLILGALATLAAVGEGGGLHDGKGVVRWIMNLPAGKLLVGIAAIGFAAYAVYGVALLCVGDESARGRFAGLAARAKGAIGCLVYGSLALTSDQLLLGHSSQGDAKRMWIASLLTRPWGRVLFGLAGVLTIGFGLYQLKFGLQGKHRNEVDGQAMSAAEQRSFLWIGRTGLAARGVVLGVIGYFILRAAIEVAPGGDNNTASALREIRHMGVAPLATIAVGLIAYGLLQFFYARYRRVQLG